jgi:hypothetical protein
MSYDTYETFYTTTRNSLSGSEAEALAVPIDQQGKWLPERIDLDSHGEIMRIGVQRALVEGRFTRIGSYQPSSSHTKSKSPSIPYDDIPPTRSRFSPGHIPTTGSPSKDFPKDQSSSLFIIEEEVDIVPADAPPRKAALRSSSSHNSLSDDLDRELSAPAPVDPACPIDGLNGTEDLSLSMDRVMMSELNGIDQEDCSRLLLESGMEIRSYSLSSSSECTTADLLGRSVSILSAPIPYDPSVDLVAADLRVTPAVVAAIDRAWATPHSIGHPLHLFFAPILSPTNLLCACHTENVPNLLDNVLTMLALTLNPMQFFTLSFVPLERISASSLGACLVQCMQQRLLYNEDSKSKHVHLSAYVYMLRALLFMCPRICHPSLLL